LLYPQSQAKNDAFQVAKMSILQDFGQKNANQEGFFTPRIGFLHFLLLF
jgi:hypothetical protein